MALAHTHPEGMNNQLVGAHLEQQMRRAQLELASAGLEYRDNYPGKSGARWRLGKQDPCGSRLWEMMEALRPADQELYASPGVNR